MGIYDQYQGYQEVYSQPALTPAQQTVFPKEWRESEREIRLGMVPYPDYGMKAYAAPVIPRSVPGNMYLNDVLISPAAAYQDMAFNLRAPSISEGAGLDGCY